MRRILGDRRMGGLFAAVVAYVMLFQGLVSAFAQSALAAGHSGPTFVICSLTGAIPGTQGTVEDQPLERAAHHCCAALCHAAASHSPILPSVDLGPTFVPEAGARPHSPTLVVLPRPNPLGLLPEARAPPFVSI